MHHKSALEGAGIEFYKQAAAYNWEVTFGMMRAASQFITDRKTELEANNNMPPTFQAELDQLHAELFEMYKQFFQEQNQAKEKTNQKIDANNKIFRLLMLMLRDAQQIYRHQPALRKQFTFRNLRHRVTNEHKTDKSE